MDNNNQNQQIIAQNEQAIAQQQTQQVVQQQVQAQQPVVYVQQPAQVQQYAVPQQQVVYVQQPVQQGQVASSNKGKGLGLGIPGLILGVISIIYALVVVLMAVIIGFVCVEEMSYFSYYYDSVLEYAGYEGYLLVLAIYSFLALIFAIPGIILSGLAKKHLNGGIAKSGFVLNLITLISMGLVFIVSLFGTALYM